MQGWQPHRLHFSKSPSLIDGGAHMVLICPNLVTCLNLSMKPLKKPEQVNVTLGSVEHINQLTHYITIMPMSLDNCFHSQPLHAVITPGLCMPLTLALPFLCTNCIACNYADCTHLVTTMIPPYNLLNVLLKVIKAPTLDTLLPDILASLKECTTTNSIEEELATRDSELWARFSHIFEPPPHINELPEELVARIKLKDQNLCIKMQNYPCSRKWKDVWHILLQQHLEMGWIHPSSAPVGSGAFIIPKADPNVLPCWVNDYWQLNTNTVINCFPIPLVHEILSDLGQGKVFVTLDMTNRFFQTCMHPNNVHLTAVNTLWGLYKWVVMPMGIKNAPVIHQHQVTNALRPWIGQICHVYMDNIAIWSKTVEEHTQNVATILQALLDHKLYMNPKKSKLFCS